MAIDWTSDTAVNEARQKAISVGYKAKDVDEFIAQQRSNAATIKLAQQGKLDPTVYKSLQGSNPQLAEKITQSGYDPAAQANKASVGDAKSLIQSTLQNFLNVPQSERSGLGYKASLPILNKFLAPTATEYESGVKGEAPALGKIFGGQGSGLRITQAEINNWTNLLPSVHKSDAQNGADVQRLDTLLKGRFGKDNGLDQSIINQFSKGGSGQGSSAGGLLSNAGKDAANIANNMLNVPAQAVKAATSGNIQAVNPNNVLGNMALGYGKELNEAAGRPLEGGDILGRIASRAYQKPVTTALDVLPFLQAGKAALATRGGEAASTAAEAVANNGGGASPQGVRTIADLVNGGGSKDFIKQSVGKPTAVPENQVLLEEGILSHPTETGRIQATSTSLKKYGSQLGDIYTNSPKVYTGDELRGLLTDKLKNAGYDDKAIQYISRYVGQQGNFNLASGDNVVPVSKVWQAAQKLEQAPPKMVNNPEAAGAYKELSKDAARALRGSLGQQLPETQPLNARYSALSDYLHNRLSDPQGLQVKNGIINTVLNGGKDTVVNPALNAIYKIAHGGAPPVISPVPPAK